MVLFTFFMRLTVLRRLKYQNASTLWPAPPPPSLVIIALLVTK